ncbi:uncharacterized protein LOC112271004 [Brachypodium distachyon]|uniref:uncharacterized protein LOC112271004 n=1 Tax=Brachypodium distachyon TaxID=15368 RepID=UPI000D0D0E53|nr:uncharacterized protein LOC112271004 [Brachypodium distachyon]|eukprot:XP_024315633.1 uncharacterized protein LOC112271004 [Brachypodium distachyon]
MAEIVSSAASAIVEEAVSLVFSGITTTTRKDEDKSDQAAAEDGLERLEMARIKMEAALETSDKWQITDLSLLHWRKKLKSAAQDCDHAVRRSKQLSQDEEEREQLYRSLC